MPVALVLGFILVPLAELYVISRVGRELGLPLTLAVLLLVSVAGAWLVKREGRRTWQALRLAMGSRQLPTRELSDAALVLIGGVLLLTPGFLTDVVGLALVLPPTRAVARRVLTTFAVRRALRSAGGSTARTRRTAARPSAASGTGSRPQARGVVIEGEVVPDPGATEPNPR